MRRHFVSASEFISRLASFRIMDVTQPKPAYQRPPWPAAVAALLAYAALALSSRAFVPIIGLVVALSASYAVSVRFQNETLTKWTLRLVVMSAAVTGYLFSAVKDENAFVDVRYLYSFALLAAAELMLQFWRREPTGGARAPFTVFLSAMVFLVGCSTVEEASGYLLYLAPLFFLFFTLALPGFRQRAGGLGALKYAFLPVLAVLVLGGLTRAGVTRYKSELNMIGSQALSSRRLSPSMGMSGQPILGSSFTLRDSLTRVLRIEHPGTDFYLRGMTFDTYSGRTWGPGLDQRTFLNLPHQAALPGPKARYERLDDSLGLLFMPLHSAAITPEQTHPLEWAARTNGPLRTPPTDTTSLIYDVTEGSGGILEVSPNAEERARDLTVPPDIDPRVLKKAHEVADSQQAPGGKITAIVRFLQTNNAYSLTVDPGAGEPISNFILQRKAAHCEYFASAAVIMLRAAGVPTRYVSGYYAHESGGKDALLVRQRDAHAWAESWVTGSGWVTVDATPGGGRPDAQAGAIPFYWQAWERVQDSLGAVRTWVLTANWFQKGAVFLLLVSGLLIPQVYRYLRGRRAQIAGFRYSSSDTALALLSVRFETLLARRGAPVPETRTWPEHLRDAAFEDSALKRFVQDYSAARFGPPPSPTDIQHLDQTLHTLEKKS